jgi:hypothetical protein
MQATSPAQDFEQWIALTDAYAEQIARVWREGEGIDRPRHELQRLSHDLQAIDQDFHPLIRHTLPDSDARKLVRRQSAA